MKISRVFDVSPVRTPRNHKRPRGCAHEWRCRAAVEAAYREGEAGRPCPNGADDREKRIWRFAYSRYLAGLAGAHLTVTRHPVRLESDESARRLLALLDALAADGDLTADEAAERDRLRASLGLA